MTKNNPQISIIIPCYNEERHIKDCLDSLIDDYVADSAEILIADGMSTDDTREIVKAIEYLLEHPQQRQEMGANGRWWRSITGSGRRRK